LTPSSGSVGSRVILSLSSTTFPLEGDYAILWSDTSSFDASNTVILKTGTVPRSSYSVSDSFIVPETGKGRYYVQYQRLGRDDPVTFQFDLVPSMKLSPSSTTPGNKVTLSCRGFPANETGSIMLDGKSIGVDIKVNNAGSFTTAITVPNMSAGGRIFEADVSKLYPEKMTTVLQVVPEISIEPNVPNFDDQVTITGHGFADDSKVSIQYGNSDLTNSPLTDESGNFTYNFYLPESSQNAYSIVARDTEGNSATLTLSIGGKKQQQPDPPPEAPTEPVKPKAKPLWKPHAISPNGGIFGVVGTSSVSFRWQQVTNAKNVTYTIEVADNTGFVHIKPDMQKSGLHQSGCTLNVEPGRYYWRVKAIDGSGNESEWAYAPASFQVGIISVDNLLKGIIFFLAFLMILVVIVLASRALSRRARDYYY
jgi:hypothetical protein